jgi:hypothetical protein
MLLHINSYPGERVMVGSQRVMVGSHLNI